MERLYVRMCVHLYMCACVAITSISLLHCKLLVHKNILLKMKLHGFLNVSSGDICDYLYTIIT